MPSPGAPAHSTLLRYCESRRQPMCIDNEAVRSGVPRFAIEAALREQYEPCFRVMEARVAEWVRSGRSPSRLLEADELRVVRRWLGQARAWGLETSDDLQRLVADSEGAQNARAAHLEA